MPIRNAAKTDSVGLWRFRVARDKNILSRFAVKNLPVN